MRRVVSRPTCVHPAGVETQGADRGRLLELQRAGVSVLRSLDETSRNRNAAGMAAPTGDPAAQRGHEPVGGGARRECIGELGVSLGRDVPAKRITWTGSPADAGRPPRLSRAQRARLERVLLKGPRAAGYPTELWTLARVAEVIRRLFGVRYHPSHVWRLLHQMDGVARNRSGVP